MTPPVLFAVEIPSGTGGGGGRLPSGLVIAAEHRQTQGQPPARLRPVGTLGDSGAENPFCRGRVRAQEGGVAHNHRPSFRRHGLRGHLRPERLPPIGDRDQLGHGIRAIPAQAEPRG